MARKPNATPPVVKPEDEIEKDDDLPVVEGDEAEVQHANGDGSAVDDSVESLKEQLAAANRRAETAERDRASAQNTTTKTQDDLETTNLRVIETAIEKETGAKEAAKAKIRAAKEAGDYDGEVAALDDLQQANINLKALSGGKDELNRRIEDKKNLPTDPVERFVVGLNSKAASWVRAHGDIIRDGKADALNRAHYAALGEELTPNTDEYFDFIEQRLKLKEPVKKEEPRTEQPRRQQMPPSAPPSRNGNGAGGGELPTGVTLNGDGSYRLSPELREGARISGQSDAEYLKNLLALKKEGRLHLN